MNRPADVPLGRNESTLTKFRSHLVRELPPVAGPDAILMAWSSDNPSALTGKEAGESLAEAIDIGRVIPIPRMGSFEALKSLAGSHRPPLLREQAILPTRVHPAARNPHCIPRRRSGS